VGSTGRGVARTTCCPGRAATSGLQVVFVPPSTGGMAERRIDDREGHAHFVTFSCSRRRRLLELDRARRIVLGVLNSQLARQHGRCVGFVVMPDHVHAIVWFPEPDQLSHFMKQWKQRSSVQIKRHLADDRNAYAATFPRSDPVWQPRYYEPPDKTLSY
jgi:putative transposase